MRKSSTAVTAALLGAALLAPQSARAACSRDWRTLADGTTTVSQLDSLLADSGCEDDLLAFTKKEKSDENIMFLRAVRAGQDKRAIYNLYVVKKGINISSGTKNRLSMVANKGNWARLDFTDAVTEIKQLVAGDTLRRYYLSKK